MLSIGLDIGSVCAKIAAFDGNQWFLLVKPTGWNVSDTASGIFTELLAKNKLQQSDVKMIISTGYGRDTVKFADKKVTEITCHAKGAIHLNSDIRTVIDVGGQDSKAIAVTSAGKVKEFIMNDKCAAGTGRFLQVMSQVLGTKVNELELLANSGKPVEINSMCAVFAESEVVGLLGRGFSPEDIAGGVLHSISSKIIHLTGKIALESPILFTGGVASNEYIRKLLADRLKSEVISHEKSQFAGAIGAALIGFESINKET